MTSTPNDATPRHADLDKDTDSDSPRPGLPGPAGDPDEHEGATEEDVGDRSGPGAGYDNEPEQEKDTGGVAES